MECLQTIGLGVNCDAVEHYREGERDLVACGMYELVEGKRIGQIALFALESKQLNKVHQVDTSGVFDIKWNNGRLGAACADGQLHVFDSDLSPQSSLSIAPGSFCLALAWINSSTVAVSCSDGTISLCDLEAGEVVHQYAAHTYPHDSSMPAEVWTVASDGENMLASGADEGALKLWDVRAPYESASLLAAKRGVHGDCGVCSLQFSSSTRGLLSGGYDGHVRLWDLALPHKSPPAHSTPAALGGGVWRIKQRDGEIFTACMRGGFQLLQSSDLSPISKYTEQEPQWEALAYGADWITDKLVAGCSFYDRKFRLFELS
ncbi:hypothetical protein BASA81_003008 [Batrachochytrium salamandrivorans]|nr:hypothetical protein BASA81_003008 [Batrachochytrium salamandrivorans]